MSGIIPRIRIGGRIGELTVLGKVDERSPDPVYLVWHHGSWCPMACKVFRSERRARREAHALSSLHHPNIVRCFGFFPPTHILMEFLEGPTLHRLIARRGRLTVSNALRVAIHLGAALQHVHASGFLHLDVKPANVIVVHGRPILFDFGSMRAKDAPRPPEVAGTDPYIAPEECLLQQAGESADVFGLGVTLHEMLTGRRPFADGTRRRPYPQIGREPIRLRHHRPAAPAALEALILRSLEKDPARRPALADLLPALHDLIRTGPRMWPAELRPLHPPARRGETAFDPMESDATPPG